MALGGRRWELDEYVGEVEGTPGGGICMDCDDERRKKGIDDGVNRLVEGPRRIERYIHYHEGQRTRKVNEGELPDSVWRPGSLPSEGYSTRLGVGYSV